MNKITVYDTTLRDGMQGIEVSFTLQDKLAISHALDDIGVDYIEGGFPLSNEKEEAFFNQVKKEKFSHAKIVAFGSTRHAGKKAAEDAHIQALLNAETETVVVVGKTWKAHVEKVLRTDTEENLEMIRDSISYLKSRGREVFFDLEHFFDGYRDDPDYALRVLQAGSDAGADCLVMCDTNGGVLPHEVEQFIREIPRDKLAPLGVHFHDDSGVATANSLTGIRSGAIHIQGTINGWGERCGNANLCVVVPNLALKCGYEVNMSRNLEHLTSLSRFVAEKANIIPEKRQPYVGIAAFSHKAGQHADVIAKAPELMEHIDGAKVGNERRILLSELAGKSSVLPKLKKYGKFDRNSKEVLSITKLLKEKENQGYEYEAAEASFDLLVRKHLDRYRPMLELDNYHLESYKTGDTPSKTVGRIFMRIDRRQVMGAGVGIGPVETLDAALRDALLPFYPFIEKISLIDYKVRVLNPQEAAASKVRVFITSTDHKENSWDTVGVSENIVEASWDAIVESFEYYYNTYMDKRRD
ncbi:citramalate synthase [Marispirochaeta aestuarii]|uniref:citramalate synthase n=1 Tax=Marispirochaeta aestuarii TaxID=1963862 RepID=UPI0029C9AD34|nr:citramalate synthase [Marispirochaeta aestuarii]